MHLWGTATQQINESWVKGHDGISQMHTVLLVLFLTTKPANPDNVIFYKKICCAAVKLHSDLSKLLVGVILSTKIEFTATAPALTWSACLS